MSPAGPDHGRQPDEPIDAAARDWFVRLAGDEVSARERAVFEAWLDGDPRHRAAYAEIGDLWNDIAPLKGAFAPRRTAFRPGRRALLGGLAAAGLAAAGASFALDLPLRLQADHRTAVGEQARIALPDGTLAFLNTDTAIAVDYAENRRRIALLQGEALFEIAHAPARPFEVTACGGRATAVGTAFAVRSDSGTASVTVTEGEVHVTAPEGGGPTVALKAGVRVRYREGGAPGALQRIAPASATAWRDGMIVIDGIALPEALAEIDRYRPGRILLLADRSRLGPITARISLRNIDSGVRALAATHGLSVTAVTERLLIVR